MKSLSRPAAVLAAATALAAAGLLTGCGGQEAGGGAASSASAGAGASVAPAAEELRAWVRCCGTEDQVCTTGATGRTRTGTRRPGSGPGSTWTWRRNLGKSLGAEVGARADLLATWWRTWTAAATSPWAGCFLHHRPGAESWRIHGADLSGRQDPVVRCGEEEKYDAVGRSTSPRCA
ncbi:hypothetical protein QJS66_13290 [Kocuria rhizophila]|nr:hypothetical protein QJS66_13290 [Kocuria rhizophila]